MYSPYYSPPRYLNNDAGEKRILYSQTQELVKAKKNHSKAKYDKNDINKNSLVARTEIIIIFITGFLTGFSPSFTAFNIL